MAIDQPHEQKNANVKDTGGATGLTENANALARWIIAGPEIAIVVQEFESKSKDSPRDKLRHHDQSSNVQHKFKYEIYSGTMSDLLCCLKTCISVTSNSST